MPMVGKVLLDTNIIVALFKGDGQVVNRIAQTAEVFVPVIAIGELIYGAKHSGNVARNMTQVLDFSTHSVVLDCDETTAEHYGDIKNMLKTKGKPLPENDVWIAAIGRQYLLTIVTRDQHFKEIDGLFLEQW